jgi:hypothetical protein
MAAFFKNLKMAICHKLFSVNYLHKIFTCYKMAMWPLIILRILFLFETFRDTSFLLLASLSDFLNSIR